MDTQNFECQRCGQCCKSAFIALQDVPLENDSREIVRWLQAHGIEVMRYPGPNGDVAAINIPIPCKYLAQESQSEKTHCRIYEQRPNVCRDYLCQRNKEAAIVELVKEHGICL